MPPRQTKRHQYQDDYTEDSDDNTTKRPRREKVKEEGEQNIPSVRDESDYAEAIEALKKQRDDSLLLINTEHQMRLDSANKLAKFEEERLQMFYENEIKELRRKIIEEKSQSNKRNASEGIYRKHRIVLPKHDDHSTSKKEDVTLTVPLAEDVVVEDVRFMVSELYNMRSKYNPQTENVVVVLPGNRLIVNDFFIESGMQCTMKNGDEIVTGQFISADSKEMMFKPDKEKRKKVSLDLLRSGEITLSYEQPEEETKISEDNEEKEQ